ncbi:mitochondrial substrate carrier family protein [Actinidia rufa]|uniref:Mitochondrial substrate carrier family protein n=1 Tax=Actinidia rufa TaxID=165716 RepID=A0A7J0F3E8_9ERIC|nr:mitochondrial substrate carrier family protein [Actinidia rufa]
MEARVGHGASVVDDGARKLLKSHHHNHNHHQHQPSSAAALGTVPQLLAGGIAGAFSKTCTAPLARLTILLQVQGMHSDVATLGKTSIWREASRIVNEEGFRAFWKGNLVTIAHRLPYTAVNFYAYERYKSMLKLIPGIESHQRSASADIFVHFVGGGLAGMTAASVTYPLDLVRTRLAAQGVGPSIAISFSVYEALRSYWHAQRPDDSTVVVSLACGSLSGIASSTATFPLDLVRRRKQLEGVAGQARVYQTSLLGTFKHIMRTEGLRGFYRGILPELKNEVWGSNVRNIALQLYGYYPFYLFASPLGNQTSAGKHRLCLSGDGTECEVTSDLQDSLCFSGNSIVAIFKWLYYIKFRKPHALDWLGPCMDIVARSLTAKSIDLGDTRFYQNSYGLVLAFVQVFAVFENKKLHHLHSEERETST